MKDLSKDSIVSVLLNLQQYSETVQSSSADLIDAKDATLFIAIGANSFTDENRIDFKLEESDDGITYSSVEAKDVVGADGEVNDGIVASVTYDLEKTEMKALGYVGNRRYLRLTAMFSGTHATGTILGAMVVQFLPYRKPKQ